VEKGLITPVGGVGHWFPSFMGAIGGPGFSKTWETHGGGKRWGKRVPSNFKRRKLFFLGGPLGWGGPGIIKGGAFGEQVGGDPHTQFLQKDASLSTVFLVPHKRGCYLCTKYILGGEDKSFVKSSDTLVVCGGGE